MSNPNPSHPEIFAYLQRFHAATDALSPRSWVLPFFSPSATVNFANNPPLTGHDALLAVFEPTHAALEEMKHTVVSFDVVGDTVYQAARIEAVVRGDPVRERFVVKGFAVFELEPEEVRVQGEERKTRRFDVYLDMSEVMKRIAEVAAAAGKVEESN